MRKLEITGYAGEHIEEFARRMQSAFLRQLHPAQPVHGEFNEIQLTHTHDSTVRESSSTTRRGHDV